MGSPPTSASGADIREIPAGPLLISEVSRDLIIEFETGGKSYYESRLQHPTWPGGASGVTIGLGYDVGYNTRSQVLADWRSLPSSHAEAIASASGVKGVAAKTRASALKWITVPWSTSESVFVDRTMPRFGNMTATAFPGVTKTNGDVQGVMLSLVFNRGASVSGTSRVEMLNCRNHIAAYPQRLSRLPSEIRSMKRLWVGKGLDGLLRRRSAEAALIESSI